jgi:hypothetical protein
MRTLFVTFFWQMFNNFGEKWVYCSSKFGFLIVGEIEEQFFLPNAVR